jgi:hypothetical protein
MASAEASVRAARDLGADQVPNAAIQVKRADDEIKSARTLTKKGENDLADVVLQRAGADAELASAYVLESDARAKERAALERAGVPATTPERPNNPGPLYIEP